MPDTNLTAAQWALYLGVAAVLLLICAFFTASETSLLSVRDSRIAQLVEEGNGRARSVQNLRERRQTMLVTIQIIVTLVTTLASALATEVALSALSPWGKTAAVTVATVIVLFFLSLLGEITPKNWAVNHAERLALLAAPVVAVVSRVIYPVVWLLEGLSIRIIRLFGARRPTTVDYPSEEEIKLIVEEGARFGELEQEEKEMIHNVLEIPGRTAREVMTPRTQIVAADVGSSIAEVAELVVQEGHSRIPIYRGTLDDIIGIVHARDLLRMLHQETDGAEVEHLVMEPLQIPESKRLDKLLQEFRSQKVQIAVVVDEYGGTAGLVTMEDVLEEIVGEISDEYDEPEEREIQAVAPGEYVVAGSASLEDVIEHLDLKVEEDDTEGTDTIGGLVFGLLGRIPEPGDTVEYGGWRFLVERVEGRRIDRLRLTRLGELSADEEPPEVQP